MLVLDRGFRDCIDVMEKFGIEVAMPSFLHGKRQFDVSDANHSRLVTKVRWIVESVNGRLKQFKFFNQTVQNCLIPHLKDYLLITCAILNYFKEPLAKSKLEDNELATSMLALVDKRNEVQNMIIENNLLSRTFWKKIKSSTYIDFPILTEEQLRSITFGKNSTCSCLPPNRIFLFQGCIKSNELDPMLKNMHRQLI